MSEFLIIDVKTLYDGVFQFYQTGLIHILLEATVLDYCNGFTMPKNSEAPHKKYDNGTESKRYCPNLYASGIWIMLYPEFNKIPDISLAAHQCARFTHNTKVSHNTFSRLYVGISKVPSKRLWCLTCPRK